MFLDGIQVARLGEFVPVAGNNEAWRFVRALTLRGVDDTRTNPTTGSAATASPSSAVQLGLVLRLHTWCLLLTFSIIQAWK